MNPLRVKISKAVREVHITYSIGWFTVSFAANEQFVPTNENMVDIPESSKED